MRILYATARTALLKRDRCMGCPVKPGNDGVGMRALEIEGKAQRTPATRNPLQSDFEHHPPRHRPA